MRFIRQTVLPVFAILKVPLLSSHKWTQEELFALQVGTFDHKFNKIIFWFISVFRKSVMTYSVEYLQKKLHEGLNTSHLVRKVCKTRIFCNWHLALFIYRRLRTFLMVVVENLMFWLYHLNSKVFLYLKDTGWLMMFCQMKWRRFML